MAIIEEDNSTGNTIFYYQIKTPNYMQTRDALILKKTLKDFPSEGDFAIVHRSTTHPDFPEDIRKCIRIE